MSMYPDTHVLLPFCGLIIVLVMSGGCLSQAGDDGREGVHSLEFKNYVGVGDANDTFMVIGTAQNTGDLPIKYVRLQIDYLDRNRTLLASRIYEEDVIVLPGATWDFEFSITGPDVPDIYYYYITPQRIDVVV